MGRERDCDTCPPVQTFDISSDDITVHEGWIESRVSTNGNDIALIRLPRLATTTYEDPNQLVLPICLPFKLELDANPRTRYFVAGWGKSIRDLRDRGDFAKARVLTRQLQFAELPFYEPVTCGNRFHQFLDNIHPERHVCAGGDPGNAAK